MTACISRDAASPPISVTKFLTATKRFRAVGELVIRVDRILDVLGERQRVRHMSDAEGA